MDQYLRTTPGMGEAEYDTIAGQSSRAVSILSRLPVAIPTRPKSQGRHTATGGDGLLIGSLMRGMGVVIRENRALPCGPANTSRRLACSKWNTLCRNTWLHSHAST